MRTYIGIVCEKSKNDMIFMTNEGEFLRGIPLDSNPEIGDEVEFQVVATSPLRSKRKSAIIWPALVASIFLIFLVSSFMSQTQKAYAYIQLNNEIELGVDEHGQIAFVHILNEKQTYEVETLEGLPIEIALSKAIKEVAPNNEKVEITTEYVKQHQNEIKETVEKAVNQVRNEQTEKSSNNNRTIPKDNTQPVSDKTIKNKEEKEQQSPVNEHKGYEKQLENSTNNHSSSNQTVPNHANKKVENPDNSKQQKEDPKPIQEKPTKTKGNHNEKLSEDKTNVKSANIENKDKNKNNKNNNNNSNSNNSNNNKEK